jgi:hypothetical protein
MINNNNKKKDKKSRAWHGKCLFQNYLNDNAANPSCFPV